MIHFALNISFGAVVIAMALCLARLIKGPTAVDRVLALDTLSINAIALLMLVGIRLQNDVFFEAGLLLAMVGFVATVSLCKHIAGRSLIR